jgi:hypothetical protein
LFSSTCPSEEFFQLFVASFSNHLNSSYRKKRLIIYIVCIVGVVKRVSMLFGSLSYAAMSMDL